MTEPRMPAPTQPDPASRLRGALEPPPPSTGRRFVSDAQRYRQYGNAVCAPVVAMVTRAAQEPPTD